MEKLEKIISDLENKQVFCLNLPKSPTRNDVEKPQSGKANISQQIAETEKAVFTSLKVKNLLSKIIQMRKPCYPASPHTQNVSRDPTADESQAQDLNPGCDRKRNIQISPESDLNSKTTYEDMVGVSEATKVEDWSDDCPSESSFGLDEIPRRNARQVIADKVRWWMSHKDFDTAENPDAAILLENLSTTHLKIPEPMADNLSSSITLSKIESSPKRTSSPPPQAKRLKMETEHKKFRVAMSRVMEREGKKEIIEKLGGTIVETAMDATVLMTGEFVRTIKILVAVARGVPIVGCDWLESSEKMDHFLDPWDYLLTDPGGEDHIGFKIKTCLKKSVARQKKPLLGGWSIFVTKNVKPPRDAMKALVESCGGYYIDKAPRERWPKNARIISCQEDATEVKKLKNRPTVLKAEWIIRAVLGQRLESDDKYELAI